MKKITLILLLVFISWTSSLKKLNPFDGYNGNPKQVEEISYKINYFGNTTPIEKSVFKDVNFFDAKGRKTKTVKYQPNGTTITDSIHYSYDTSGNKIKEINYNKEGEVKFEYLYKYDSYNKEIEKVYGIGNKKTITKKTYDRKNKKVDITGTKNNGSFKVHDIKTFNDNWDVIEHIKYDSIGHQKIRTEFGYDKNNNLNSTKLYDTNNTLFDVLKTTYNGQNEMISTIGYNIKDNDTINKAPTRVEYKYDDKKNAVEKKLFSEGKCIWMVKYNYQY